MKETNFIILEVLLVVTLINTIIIVDDFIRIKDGQLRKIMIAYFLVECWIWGSAIVYIWMDFYGYRLVRIGVYLMLLVVPKFLVKTWLRRWQINERNKR